MIIFNGFFFPSKLVVHNVESSRNYVAIYLMYMVISLWYLRLSQGEHYSLIAQSSKDAKLIES
jgi:hypothetical protein